MSCVCKLLIKTNDDDELHKYTYKGAKWRLVGVDNSTMISV